MKRFVFIWYIVLILLLPLSVVMLSGDIVLRVSETYIYHFNDSQVIDEVGSYVTGSEFADAITDYFNSPTAKDFQVYEENGEYRDPIFEEVESTVMKKCKKYMTGGLWIGIILLAASISLYVYLTSSATRVGLRRAGFMALGLSFALVVFVDISLLREKVRESLYDKFIGIELSRTSALKIMLSSPFERTYIVFSTVVAVAMISLMLYIHSTITREKRIFS